MIHSLSIKGFKSLADVSLQLGMFNLFLGANASGKSNFFDALRVLQGIGYGFTVDEVLNGKPKTANSDVWEQIRGGSSRASFVGKSSKPNDGTNAPEQVIRFHAKLQSGGSPEVFDYSIGISAKLGCVREESLSVDGQEIYDSKGIVNDTSQPYFQVRYYRGTVGRQPHFSFEKSKPVLHQILQKIAVEDQESVKICIRALSNTQRIDPSPSVLREYSTAQSWVRRMGEHGENFAALVKTILRNSVSRDRYLSWLKQLTPIEFEDVVILPGALGEPLFALKEGGTEYPAPVLSDGTLRFAAIAAAFFQEDMPDILTIEEIENGIHASRLRLLVELLKTQSSVDWTQVMATTHSPVVLAWLENKDYKTTFYCKREEETGASTITPLSDVPNFQEALSREPINDLFAEGWLEATL